MAEPSSACLPDGFMFDALGQLRTRYVRVIHDGTTLVLTPAEAEGFKSDARSERDDREYEYRDVYLSEREAEGLPEFDGF